MTFKQTIRRWSLFLVVVGCMIALFGIGGVLGTWYTIRVSVKREEVTIPELHGLTAEEATKKITELGLQPHLAAGTPVHSNVIAEDHVLLQVPAPGRKVKAGRTVEFTLSAGPERRELPDLVGKTLTFAGGVLSRDQFQIQQTTRIHSNLPKGRILAQHPGPGEDLGLRSGVSLLVSDGPAETEFVMPNLIGRNYAEVKAFLDQNQMRVVTKYKAGDESKGRLILEQLPKAGYPVDRSTNITLIVNKDF